MGIFRTILWQKQTLRINSDKERKVTFLELFYDLVFVICIAQIAHPLTSHPTFTALGRYVLLCIPVFWAWIGGSVYYDLHGVADVKTRLYTFIQMLFIAAITIYSKSAFDLSHAVFPLVLAAQFLFLALLNWRTAIHNPPLRPFYYLFTVQVAIAVVLLVVSAFIGSQWRYALWGLGFAIIIFSPRITYEMRKRVVPKFRLSESLRERFGLFTIIVLGEMLFGIINTVSQLDSLSLRSLLLAVVGIVMTINVWWIYFDYLGFGRVQEGKLLRWNIGHALLVISIPALGAGVSAIINAHTDDHTALLTIIMLSGSIALILTASKIVMTVLERPERLKHAYRRGQRALGFAMALTVLLAVLYYLGAYNQSVYIALTALALLIPVIIGIQIWVTVVQAARENNDT